MECSSSNRPQSELLLHKSITINNLSSGTTSSPTLTQTIHAPTIPSVRVTSVQMQMVTSSALQQQN